MLTSRRTSPHTLLGPLGTRALRATRLHITDDSVRIGKVAETDLLNGAQNWEQYSYGGCAEVYDGDICERLCTESQKKKTRDGELPLMGEDWLTVQARALWQAARIVIRYANRRD